MKYFSGNKVYFSEDYYYTLFKINKRIIFAPCKELKTKQRYFLKVLQRVYPINMSTLNCAKAHCDKKWVLKMDIQDFFNSVQYYDIYKVVRTACSKMKNANVNYYLDITTIDEKLPTGAVTSSHIANACFSELDSCIQNYANIFGMNYTRYMDDLTFSSDDKRLLNIVEEWVRNLLYDKGYKINNKKVKYISQNKQQNILGLVVNNDKPVIPKSEKRKIRAAIHGYLMSKIPTQTKPLKYYTWNKKREEKLNGYLAYYKCVDNKFYQSLKKYYEKLKTRYKINQETNLIF